MSIPGEDFEELDVLIESIHCTMRAPAAAQLTCDGCSVCVRAALGTCRHQRQAIGSSPRPFAIIQSGVVSVSC